MYVYSLSSEKFSKNTLPNGHQMNELIEGLEQFEGHFLKYIH